MNPRIFTAAALLLLLACAPIGGDELKGVDQRLLGVWLEVDAEDGREVPIRHEF